MVIDCRQEIGGVHRLEQSKTAGCKHGFATATAAVADEIDLLANVFPKLHEVVAIGCLEQVQPLRGLDGTGVAVSYQRGGRAVEGHADVLRRVAGPADVRHLVTAVADADPPVAGRADHLARPFIVKDMQGILGIKRRLMDEYSTELGLTIGKERFDEVVFHIQILVEELAQDLLVDIIPHPHERKFKKSGHRWREDIGRFAVLLQV